MIKISSQPLSLFGIGLALAISLPVHAQAQTALQECSAQYGAAKSANQLKGQSWTEFRSQCQGLQMAQANPLKSAAPANVNAPAPQAPSQAPAAAARANARAPATPVDPIPPSLGGAQAPAGNAIFPKAINPKYANETPAKQRSKTCLDQYNANKTSNGNGGLKWIQKGGGYYSQCSARLKG